MRSSAARSSSGCDANRPSPCRCPSRSTPTTTRTSWRSGWAATYAIADSSSSGMSASTVLGRKDRTRLTAHPDTVGGQLIRARSPIEVVGRQRSRPARSHSGRRAAHRNPLRSDPGCRPAPVRRPAARRSGPARTAAAADPIRRRRRAGRVPAGRRPARRARIDPSAGPATERFGGHGQLGVSAERSSANARPRRSPPGALTPGPGSDRCPDRRGRRS